jgi:beta-lactamase superfamily II metal-dependent hydrolase
VGGTAHETRRGSLTIVDVGHGNCALISDGAINVLIDAGPGSGVLELLDRADVRRLDWVVLSHADADHIRGLVALLGAGRFEVGRVVLNSDAMKQSDLWISLVYELDERRERGELEFDVQLREGDRIAPELDGISLEVLAPRVALAATGPGSRDPDGRRITTNTISAVILVLVDGRRIALLAGDLDKVGFDHLCRSKPNLAAEVLVFPHHGGLAGVDGDDLTAFAKDLTAAAAPRHVIFSMARGGPFENPRLEVVEGVRSAAPDVHIACTQLSVRCSSLVPSVAPPHLLPLYASGYSMRHCCAGTLRFNFAGDSDLMPAATEHVAFVSENARTALCMT